jgi:hypothetical protein
MFDMCHCNSLSLTTSSVPWAVDCTGGICRDLIMLVMAGLVLG